MRVMTAGTPGLSEGLISVRHREILFRGGMAFETNSGLFCFQIVRWSLRTVGCRGYFAAIQVACCAALLERRVFVILPDHDAIWILVLEAVLRNGIPLGRRSRERCADGHHDEDAAGKLIPAWNAQPSSHIPAQRGNRIHKCLQNSRIGFYYGTVASSAGISPKVSIKLSHQLLLTNCFGPHFR
jgi:hypothetical protein